MTFEKQGGCTVLIPPLLSTDKSIVVAVVLVEYCSGARKREARAFYFVCQRQMLFVTDRTTVDWPVGGLF